MVLKTSKTSKAHKKLAFFGPSPAWTRARISACIDRSLSLPRSWTQPSNMPILHVRCTLAVVLLSTNKFAFNCFTLASLIVGHNLVWLLFVACIKHPCCFPHWHLICCLLRRCSLAILRYTLDVVHLNVTCILLAFQMNNVCWHNVPLSVTTCLRPPPWLDKT